MFTSVLRHTPVLKTGCVFNLYKVKQIEWILLGNHSYYQKSKHHGGKTVSASISLTLLLFLLMKKEGSPFLSNQALIPTPPLSLLDILSLSHPFTSNFHSTFYSYI